MLKFIVFSSFAFTQEVDENFDLFRNMFETSGPENERKIGYSQPVFFRKNILFQENISLFRLKKLK